MSKYFVIAIFLVIFYGCHSSIRTAIPDNGVVIVKEMPQKISFTRCDKSTSDSLYICEGFVRDSTTSDTLMGERVTVIPNRVYFGDRKGVFKIDSVHVNSTIEFYYIGYLKKIVPVIDVVRGKINW